MRFLPVVLREMSVLARRTRTYRARATMAGSGLLVAGWLLITAAAAMPTARQGQTIFLVLSSLAFGYAVLAGITTASDCLSEEKREGTLGLLFLTDLKAYDVILGKMAASSMSSSFAQFGVVPVLALAIMLGGVTLADVARIVLVLFVTLFLSLSVGVLVSSLSYNERKAMVASVIALGFLTFGPFIAGMFITGDDPQVAWVNWFSPLYPFVCVFEPRVRGLDYTSFFWVSLVFQFGLSGFCLNRAARILPGCVNDLPSARFRRWREWADRLAYGSALRRKQHRAALLDRNAFLWLAARERNKPRVAWLMIALFAGLHLWVFWEFPDMLYEPMLELVLLFLLHLIFKLWTASEVCSRLIQDRRSGALELLLSTPLSVREIASGQTLALRRIFFRPVVVLVVAEILIYLATQRNPRSTASEAQTFLGFAAGITTLLLDLWALKWVGLSLSLKGKSIERVLLGTTVRIMALPWILLVACLGLIMTARTFSGRPLSGEEIFFLYWIFSIFIDLAYAIPARMRFFRTFREAAAGRFGTQSDEGELSEAPSPAKKAALPNVPKRKPRHRAKIAWGLVVVLAIGVILARRAYWAGQLGKELERIAAEGAPTGPQDVAQYYLPVPATRNALSPLQAAGSVNLGASGRTRITVRTLSVADGALLDSETLGKYASILSVNQPQLAAFRRATHLPEVYVQPMTGSPWTFASKFEPFMALAWMDTLLAVQNHKLEPSVAGVLDLLRFAAMLRQQPVSEAQSLCLTAVDLTRDLLERMVREVELPEAALSRIANQLEQTDDETILARVLTIRRAMALGLRNGLGDNWTGGPPNPAAGWDPLLARIGSRDRNTVQLLNAYRLGIEVAAAPAPGRLDRAWELDHMIAAALWTVPPYQMWEYEMNGDFSVDAGITAMLRLQRAGIAAERFRAKNHRLPNTMEELCPEFLAQPMLDPFSGRPLNVKTKAPGILLYSWGINRSDENGKRAKGFAGDFVFHLWPRSEEAGKSFR